MDIGIQIVEWQLIRVELFLQEVGTIHSPRAVRYDMNVGVEIFRVKFQISPHISRVESGMDEVFNIYGCLCDTIYY